MSAPCSNGRQSQGVAEVLSTISGTPSALRHRGQRRDVGDVAAGVGDQLAEDRPGVVVDRVLERGEILGVDELAPTSRSGGSCG